MTTTTHTNARGETFTTYRQGSRVATITVEGAKKFHVVLYIDHGPAGLTFSDSATYKTHRGALKKVEAFLK